jgi:hypothetical protein
MVSLLSRNFFAKLDRLEKCTASVFYKKSSEENSHSQHSKASLVQVMSEKISELQGMARARRALAGAPALENWRGM